MAGWRTVKVFLSSTFRDMHAERDHLVKVTFPAVRAALLPYRVDLTDIDLRWGITEEDARNEKTVGLCLDLVDDCRPFFLAFLGHRYGWVPAAVPDDIRRRFPVIDRFPNASVTEWEIRHALADAPTAARALILLRSEEAVQSVPPGTRALFAEKAPAARDALKSLRESFTNGPMTVESYSAVWNAGKYDLATTSEGRLDGLDYFGMLVEEWLLAAIRRELNLPAEPPVIDPRDAERDLHERYMELRTRCYVGREDVYDRLAAFALGSGDQPLLLTGPSGLGKSATLSHFVRRFRREHPEVSVLAHFVGASPRTTSLAGMLQRLTAELGRRPTAGSADEYRNVKAEALRTPDELIREFLALLTEMPRNRQIVLVLDALNQLDADSRAETLVWLPSVLPPNVRVICSSATGPGQPPRVLTAFGDRPYRAEEMAPLTDAERRTILATVPKLAAKVLDAAQVGRLLDNPATANPLYLTVALEELRGFGSYEKLNAKIAALPRGNDALADLFLAVFDRLEKEVGRSLVEAVLALLACSRRGLTAPELVELVRPLGPPADDLYPLLRQLDPYLHRRDGRYDFFHSTIRRAAERRYLGWRDEEDQWDPWRRWRPNRPVPAADPTEAERDARRRLVAHFAADRLTVRAVDELPWQLAQLRSWQKLFDLLADLEFFRAAWAADPAEVRTAWSLVKTVGGLDPLDAYADHLANPTEESLPLLEPVVLWLLASGYSERVAPVYGYFIDHFRRAGNLPVLQVFLGNRALAHIQAGEYAEADALMAEEEAICRRFRMDDGLQRCLWKRSRAAFACGDLAATATYLAEMERLCRKARNAAGLQTCLGGQALNLLSANDPDRAAEVCREQEAICRRINDLDGLQTALGIQALIRGNVGDLAGAGKLLIEQEAICRQLGDPNVLQGCLLQRAMHLQNAGDTAAALAVLDEQQRVCKEANVIAGLQLGIGMEAGIRVMLGEREAAVRLLAEQEAICRRANIPAGLQQCLGTQAKLAMTAGDIPTALRLLDEQEVICRRIRMPALLQECLGMKAVLWKATARFDEALAALAEQERICRQGKIPSALQHCLGIQGEIQIALGQLVAADQLFRQQEAISRELNMPLGVIHALGCLALIRQMSDDPAGALAHYDEQERICRQVNNPLMLQQCLGLKATNLIHAGRTAEAEQLLDEQEGICRRLDIPEGIVQNLYFRAVLAFSQERLEGIGLAERALELANSHGLTVMANQIRTTLGQVLEAVGRNVPVAPADRAADARTRATAVPPPVREIDARIAALAAEREAAVAEQDFEKAAELRDRQDELTRQRGELMEQLLAQAADAPPADAGKVGPRPARQEKDTSRKRRGRDRN